MAVGLFSILVMAGIFFAAAIGIAAAAWYCRKRSPSRKVWAALLWICCGISLLLFAVSLKMAWEVLRAMIDIFG